MLFAQPNARLDPADGLMVYGPRDVFLVYLGDKLDVGLYGFGGKAWWEIVLENIRLYWRIFWMFGAVEN